MTCLKLARKSKANGICKGGECMKVYVVTSGEYSDYHIDAIFLDRQKALQYCAAKEISEDVSMSL